MSGFVLCCDLIYYGYTGKEVNPAELFQCDQTGISLLPDQEYIILVPQISHSRLSNMLCARHIQHN